MVPGVLLFHQSELELGSEELNVLLNHMANWIAGKQKSGRSLPPKAKLNHINDATSIRALHA